MVKIRILCRFSEKNDDCKCERLKVWYGVSHHDFQINFF